jgi:hypothetical protein
MGEVIELMPKPWTWSTAALANTYVLRFHDTDVGMVSFLEDVPLRTLRMDAITEALNATQSHPSLR